MVLPDSKASQAWTDKPLPVQHGDTSPYLYQQPQEAPHLEGALLWLSQNLDFTIEKNFKMSKSGAELEFIKKRF